MAYLFMSSMTPQLHKSLTVNRDKLSESRTAEDFQKRNEQEHRDRCATLNELSGQTKAFWSLQYGITRASWLAEIPRFNITECILHDPMHVLLEGVDRLVVKLLLSRLIITDKYFTLEDLNAAINNFPYSSTDSSDKPTNIEKAQILPGGSLSQSAASMRVLIYQLPFLIGDFVPQDNEHWLNFIKLMQINILSFSPYAS